MSYSTSNGYGGFPNDQYSRASSGSGPPDCVNLKVRDLFGGRRPSTAAVTLTRLDDGSVSIPYQAFGSSDSTHLLSRGLCVFGERLASTINLNRDPLLVFKQQYETDFAAVRDLRSFQRWTVYEGPTSDGKLMGKFTAQGFLRCLPRPDGLTFSIPFPRQHRLSGGSQDHPLHLTALSPQHASQLHRELRSAHYAARWGFAYVPTRASNLPRPRPTELLPPVVARSDPTTRIRPAQALTLEYPQIQPQWETENTSEVCRLKDSAFADSGIQTELRLQFYADVAKTTFLSAAGDLPVARAVAQTVRRWNEGERSHDLSPGEAGWRLENVCRKRRPSGDTATTPRGEAATTPWSLQPSTPILTASRLPVATVLPLPAASPEENQAEGTRPTQLGSSYSSWTMTSTKESLTRWRTYLYKAPGGHYRFQMSKPDYRIV